MQNSEELNAEAANSHYFSASPSKLIIMSLCTFGIYPIYWMYKNWLYIKVKQELKIMPFWRAFFSIFWFYSLLKHLQEEVNDQNIPTGLHAGTVAVLYFIALSLGSLPDPYSLLTLFSFIFLLPANTAIWRLSENSETIIKPNNECHGWNWVAVILGGAMFIFAIIGAFSPS